MEAMGDFTGGISERIDLTRTPPPGLFQILESSFERDSQLGCTINALPGIPGIRETRLPSGLVAGHAYTITDVKKVRMRLSSDYYFLYNTIIFIPREYSP